jgi:hypothetical protein
MPAADVERAIGELLLAAEFGSKQLGDAEKRQAATNWFNANADRFAAVVCANTFITQTIGGHPDRNTLFGLVCDAVAGLSGLPVPVGSLSALILNRGIERLCPDLAKAAVT